MSVMLIESGAERVANYPELSFSDEITAVASPARH
jgi:hypothetical protein